MPPAPVRQAFCFRENRAYDELVYFIDDILRARFFQTVFDFT